MTDTGLVQVKIDQAKLDSVQRMILSIPGGAARVFPRAINRTMSSARVRISRNASSATKLAVRRVRARIYMQRAGRDNWVGFLGMGNAPFDLARDFKASYSKGSGVQAAVMPGRTAVLPRAFMVTRRTSGTMAFPNRAKLSRDEWLTSLQRYLGYAKTPRAWWGYGRVLIRKPSGGEKPHWTGLGTTGQLAPRMPVMTVRGPSLAEIWEEGTQMVADAISFSQHTLEKNIDDQVKLLIKEQG